MIRDLGQRVLELESGFSLMESVKRQEIGPETAFDVFNKLVGICGQFSDLHKRIGVKAPFSESLFQSENYPSYLGLGLISHDFTNLHLGFYGYTLNLDPSIKRSDMKGIDEILRKDIFFTQYENIRIFLTLVAYLSTGDRRFLIPVDTCIFPGLLDSLARRHLNCSNNFTGFQSVPSDLYFATYQLVKNARENLVNCDISTTFRLEYNNLVVIVKDNGTGISADKLSKIFGTYTDKEYGTGIGLQVVKRIVDLKGGHVDIISTEQGKRTFKYDTRSDKVQQVGQPLTREISGTYFILYFPKSQ